MAKENILVVEDDESIAELVSYNLSQEGYAVKLVSSGEAAIKAVRRDLPDLVILDLMLPGVDGLEVCRYLKEENATRHVPIVILSAKGEEADIVTGLELGADDYVTKPFAPRVLLARVRAVLRRRSEQGEKEDTPIRRKELRIHPGRHEVTVQGEPVDLTYTEFEILRHLARRPGWVFTRKQIVDAVRGEDYPVTERSVDVQIVGLRRKLGPYGPYIETVRGVGYRFRE
jgi:two-component system phosphate regulon response regulator PhoB